jgi:hypothetical protein
LFKARAQQSARPAVPIREIMEDSFNRLRGRSEQSDR